jgi:hypothetical protein
MTVMVGGGLLVAGAFLPWLSLYAGLHPLRGVIGLNGRLIAAGGVVCLGSGAVEWRHPTIAGRRISLALGVALTAFAGWLLMQQAVVYRELSPMLVPRHGIGLFVALAGSLLAAMSGLVPAVTARRVSAPWIPVSPGSPPKGISS